MITKDGYQCWVQQRIREGASSEDFENGDAYEDAYIVMDEKGEIIYDTTNYGVVKRFFEEDGYDERDRIDN